MIRLTKRSCLTRLQTSSFISQQAVHPPTDKLDFLLGRFLELCSWFCPHFNQLRVTPTLDFRTKCFLFVPESVCLPSSVSSDGHSLENPLLFLPLSSSSLVLLTWTPFLSPLDPPTFWNASHLKRRRYLRHNL